MNKEAFVLENPSDHDVGLFIENRETLNPTGLSGLRTLSEGTSFARIEYESEDQWTMRPLAYLDDDHSEEGRSTDWTIRVDKK